MGISPATVDRARDYLENGLENGHWKSGEKLPTTRELARSARISMNAMSQAVRQLAGQGRLEVSFRRGIWVPGKPAAGRMEYPPGSRPAKRWQTVLEALRRDIYLERYSPAHPLPSLRELMALHGAGYATVKAAIAELERAGDLRRHKWGYLPRLPKHRRADVSVVLVTPFDARHRAPFESREKYDLEDFQAAFVRELKNECQRVNANLETMTTEEALRLQLRRDDPGKLGFLIWFDHSSGDIPALVKSLAPARRPVAVFAREELPGLASRFSVPVKCFAMQGERTVGKMMGQVLIAAGHRRIVFLSRFDVSWAREREAGLVEAFTAAGYPEAVNPFYGSSLTTDVIEPPDAAAIARMPSLARLRPVMKVLGQVRSILRGQRMAWRELNLREYDLSTTIKKEVVLEDCRALFEAALAVPGATAWVGANDWSVLLLLDFLERTGRARPEGVMVAGFDNTAEAWQHKVTSYDPDLKKIVQRQVEFILQAKPLARPRAAGLEVAEGRIIFR